MSTGQVIVKGTLRPDGTLELDDKPALPPGRVQVTVQPIAPTSRENTWDVLQRIWDERKAMGMPSRSREEIDKVIRELRDEWPH
jgi:hypothetical protein